MTIGVPAIDCDRLRFTSQFIDRIVRLRTRVIYPRQLKRREIIEATITTLHIQQLCDNDHARLLCGHCFFLLVYPLWYHGPRMPLRAERVCIGNLGNSNMVTIYWPHLSPNWSSFEHFGMNLTKTFVGDGPLSNTPPPQLRNDLIEMLHNITTPTIHKLKRPIRAKVWGNSNLSQPTESFVVGTMI